MYNDEKACIAVINVDNFDELTASAGDERELAISTEIDRLIRGWGEKLGAAVVRYREHLYEICLTHGNLQRLVDEDVYKRQLEQVLWHITPGQRR